MDRPHVRVLCSRCAEGQRRTDQRGPATAASTELPAGTECKRCPPQESSPRGGWQRGVAHVGVLLDVAKANGGPRRRRCQHAGGANAGVARRRAFDADAEGNGVERDPDSDRCAVSARLTRHDGIEGEWLLAHVEEHGALIDAVAVRERHGRSYRIDADADGVDTRMLIAEYRVEAIGLLDFLYDALLVCVKRVAEELRHAGVLASEIVGGVVRCFYVARL